MRRCVSLLAVFAVLLMQFTLRTVEANKKCFFSVDGVALTGHVMSTFSIQFIRDCSDKCAVTPGCQSINFYVRKSICELNNRTIENSPDHKAQDDKAVYFKNPDPLPPEPVDGNFTEWSNWTSCSLSCGNGTRYRSRSCTKPAPAHGGKNCTGPYNETQNCHCLRGLENSAILYEHGNITYLQKLSTYLQPVLQDASKSRWVRCWRADSDGWDVTKTFHPKCDNKGPTVTIVRVGSYIFGGYSDVSWDSSSTYAYSTKAFLFSLNNTRGYSPVKLPAVQNHQYAIYRVSDYGPTFGRGRDMHIHNQASSNAYSYFRVIEYKAPPGCSYNSYCSFYTGNGHFTPSDVEVFYETTN